MSKTTTAPKPANTAVQDHKKALSALLTEAAKAAQPGVALQATKPVKLSKTMSAKP